MALSDFQRLIRHVSKEATIYDTPSGTYLRWSPGAGAELWIQANLEHEIIGCNPHFSGEGKLRFGITETFHSLHSPLEGRLVGWVEPKNEKVPTSGLYPLTAEMPDFTLSEPFLFKHPLMTLQVAAFAEVVSCYANERAFAMSHNAQTMAVPTFQQSIEVEEDGSPALANIVGFVRKTELRLNPLTEQLFYAILLETHGGTIDVVAPVDTLLETPIIDSVLAGSFWLSARAEKKLSLPRPILKQQAWA